MPKNTAQLPRPELEPRLLNPDVQRTYQRASTDLHGRTGSQNTDVTNTLIWNSIVIWITVGSKTS